MNRGGPSKQPATTGSKGVAARTSTTNATNQAPRGNDPRHMSRDFKYAAIIM